VRDAICACVTALARTLKPEYAEAMRQIDVEGVRLTELAQRAGISARNGSVRVFRALAKRSASRWWRPAPRVPGASVRRLPVRHAARRVDDPILARLS
jgi:hypothetical protein